MGYKLAPDEQVEQGLRRICAEQVDAAIAEMTDPGLTRDKAIHQFRKRSKMIRAALRLVRPALGDTFAQENAWFRDEARRFSGARDAVVIQATFDGLARRFAGEARRELFAHVRDALAAGPPAQASGQVDAEQWDAVLDDLRQARERLAGWELSADGFAAIGPGLVTSYRQGRRAMRKAYQDPEPANFHEFRKRAKDLWYQTRLVRPIWDDVLGEYRSSVHDLTELLGENQDLQVLQDSLQQADISGGDREELLAVVELRRDELHRNAHPLALRIYAETPKAYGSRMASYWEVWWAPTQPANAEAGSAAVA